MLLGVLSFLTYDGAFFAYLIYQSLSSCCGLLPVSTLIVLLRSDPGAPGVPYCILLATMRNIRLFICLVIVSAGAALTYFVFEWLLRVSIHEIWQEWFNTSDQRWLVVPVSLVLGLIYFGLQHKFDKPSEGHEEHGLGALPNPSLTNYAKVLVIGLFSLLAGATLGPEAILVPASLIFASVVGVRLLKSNKQESGLLAGAAVIALFTAFFHSFFVGFISVLLVAKLAKSKLGALLMAVAFVASGVSYLTLWLVNGRALIHFSPDSWSVNAVSFVWFVPLVIAGFATTHAIKATHDAAEKIYKLAGLQTWWLHAVVASFGIAGLYLLGGEYVQFTGNEEVEPMLAHAEALGAASLIWIAVVKITLIGWSKAIGYRGGLIFPLIFVLTVYCAVAQSISSDLNMFYALVAGLIGAIVANRKLRILF